MKHLRTSPVTDEKCIQVQNTPPPPTTSVSSHQQGHPTTGHPSRDPTRLPPTSTSTALRLPGQLGITPNRETIASVTHAANQATTDDRPGLGEKIDTTPIRRREPQGGDVKNELSSIDIDSILQPKTGINARDYYDLDRGENQVTLRALERRIRQAMEGNTYLLMPVITRRHWASAVFYWHNSTVWVAVYDSAPHPMTARDFTKMFRLLKFPFSGVICHARQPSYSNDCGLHIILIAIWLRLKGISGLPTCQLPSPQVISLTSWRTILQSAIQSDSGLTSQTVERLLNAQPLVCSLIGIPKPKAPPVTTTAVAEVRQDPTPPVAQPTLNPEASPFVSRAVPHSPSSEPAKASQAADPTAGSVTAPAPQAGSPLMDANPIASIQILSRGERLNVPAHQAKKSQPPDAIDVDESTDSDVEAPADGDPARYINGPTDLSELEMLQVPLTQHEISQVRNWDADVERKVKGWFSARRAERAEQTTTVAEEIGVRIMDIPPEIECAHPDFRRILYELAEKKVRRQGAEYTAAELQRRILNSHQRGVMLTDTLVDIVAQQVASTLDSSWTVLRTTDFYLFALQGRRGTMPATLTKNVAVIIFLRPNHFVLMTHHRDRFEVRDSMVTTKPSKKWKPSAELTAMASRFIDLVSPQAKRPIAAIVHWMPCQKQALNECGIESINNLVLCTTGARGTFSRGSIRAARDFCLPRNGPPRDIAQFKFDIVPGRAPAVKGPSPSQDRPSHANAPIATTAQAKVTILRRPTSATRGEDTSETKQLPTEPSAPAMRATAQKAPKTPVAPFPVAKELHSPSPAKARDSATSQAAPSSGDEQPAPSGCKKCKRQAICDGLCAWHHDKITSCVDRKKCGAKTSNRNQRCNELALTIGGAKQCWYHSSPLALKAVRDAIAGITLQAADALPTGDNEARVRHDPYSHKVIDDSRPKQKANTVGSDSAMPHGDLTAILATLRKGTSVEIDMIRPPYQRTKYRLQIEHTPRQGFLGRAAIAARYCDVCYEWHHMDEGTIPLPEIDTHYFQVTLDPPSLEESRVSEECRFDDGGSDIDSEDLDDEKDKADIAQALQDAENMKRNEPERQFIGSAPVGPTSCIRADVLQKTYIYSSRPPHVHQGSWKKIEECSRKRHIRWLNAIKAMPDDLKQCSLAHAAIELVLRKAQEAKKAWAWSTIATNMGAIKGALKGLPAYTNARQGIDLEEDYLWHEFEQHANRLAKLRGTKPTNCEPLTIEQHEEMCEFDLKGHLGAWCLQHLSWAIKGRVGDMRRLLPENIKMATEEDETGQVPVSALFIEGKGARFWGPYTIHSHLPPPIAKVIRQYLKARQQNAHAFSTADQRLISKSVAQWKNHSLRSIRRGALIHMSECGVKLADLIKVSGHKRMETLLRYLGWGERDGEAVLAAKERSRLEMEAKKRRRPAPAGGGMNEFPMNMGIHSGLNGEKGRRVKPPAPLFAYNPVSRSELFPATSKIDRSGYRLHVKETGEVTSELYESIAAEGLRENLTKGKGWITSSENYGIQWPPMEPSQVPYSSFSTEDALVFLKNGKWRPLRTDEVIRSYVKGFLQPNDTKLTLRPVFEPYYNSVIIREQLPILHYPSEAEKRYTLAGKKYIFLFDYKAWYDQIPLADEVQSCHVVRLKEPVEWEGEMHTLFVLTKDPMGATHSAHTAQTITWAICEPLYNMNVSLVTMIDNVIVASDDAAEFVRAVQTFVQRSDRFGAMLNDRDQIPSDPEEILKMGRQYATTWTSILGAEYKDGFVRNNEKNMANLAEAYQRLQQSMGDPNVIVTRRNVAAIISLAFYMARVVEIRVAQHFHLLRLHRKVSAMRGKWDAPYQITQKEMESVGMIVGRLLLNKPIRPTIKPLPGNDLSDYEAVAIMDASATGFGAWVLWQGRTFELRSGWKNHNFHSAHAEPTAGKEVAQWIRARCRGRIAVVTDHIAMALSQRRPISGNGGFSTAYHLNEFFCALYGEDGNLDADVFYVEGQKNVTDGASRSNRIGDPLKVTILNDVTFPPLAAFWHPYRELPKRPWWNV